MSLCFLLAVCACSHDHSGDTRVDLLKLFPYTDSGQEAVEIELGSIEAAAHLLRGWSQPERLPSGESIVRAVSRESALRFAVHRPARRRIRLRCGLTAPSRAPSASHRVMLQVNGRALAPLRLHEGFEEYSVELPGDAQRAGENVLAFVQRRVVRRSREASDLTHAMACEWIRLENADGTTDVHPHLVPDQVGAGALELPPSSQVSYFLRLPSAAVLQGELRNAGEEQVGRLSVAVQGDGVDPQTVWAGDTSAHAVALDLNKFAGAIVRLDLKNEGRGTLQLREPRVVGRAPSVKTTKRLEGTRRSRPNVILYLIDTLRADHLGTYGYPLPTSPNIDALAADSFRFTRAVAQASWTRPATASILTGLYPYTHGAVTLHDALRPDATTLAELLRAQGYQTAAVVTNVNVGGGFGFDRGFDQFTYLPEDEARPTLHVSSDAVNDVVFPWLQTHGQKPFLLYIHVSDPHAPYAPPQGFAEKFRPAGLSSPLASSPQAVRKLMEEPALITPDNLRYLQSLYDGEIAFTDQNFGNLLSQLQQLGLYERSIIVLTADHGEEFHDHGGFEHGRTLYAEQLEVPLLIRLPGADHGTRQVACQARQIDVLPTLLDLLGIAVPAAVEGGSLVPALEGGCGMEEAFAQTSLAERAERRALITKEWKMLEALGSRNPGPELYDLASDPHEQHNLAEQRPVLLGYARQSLRQWAMRAARVSASGGKPPPTVGAETMERLRALGYAQ